MIASLEAERAMLGACMLDNAAVAAVGHLQPQEFYDARHGRIWGEILKNNEQGQPSDPVILGSRLPAERALLDELLSQAATSVNVGHYGNLIKSRARKRAALDALDQRRRAILDADDAALDGEITAVIDAVDSVAAGPARDGLRPLGEDVIDTLRLIEARAVDGSGLAGLATGIGALDRITGGLQPGQMTILAGRTSQGKTALAMQIAFNAAQAGHRVAVFSLEMDRHRLIARYLSANSGLSPLQVLTGRVDWQALNDAGGVVQNVGQNILLECRSALSPGMIRAELRRLRPPAELVVIDYVQLMRPPGRAENRQMAVASISRALKGLAVDLDLPVLALSQFSRQADQRSGPPQLSDLRESGSLEQDADLVLALHRPDPAWELPDKGPVQLIALKNRCGPCRAVDLMWSGTRCLFSDPAQHRREPESMNTAPS